MTKKRRKLVAFLLLAVISGMVAHRLLNQSDEPEYQGRRLSDWLEQSVWDTDVDAETQAAVRSIGTNALPYLVKWISYELPAWRMNLGNKLPAFIPQRGRINRWLLGGEASRRAGYAHVGFMVLGTNAASAIPELEALMKDRKNPIRSSRAIRDLTLIGEPAVPVLKAALGDSNQSNHRSIVRGFDYMARFHGRTSATLPILVEALNDDDILVRALATNALRDLAPEALTSAPAK